MTTSAVPRTGRGPAARTRIRIVEATLSCLRRDGVPGTSISAIARESGISRPTIYAHFGDVDEVVHAAVEHAALEITARIALDVSRADGTAASITEFIVAAHREFRADPVAALVADIGNRPGLDGAGTISRPMLDLAGAFMRPVLNDDPALLARQDDIVEIALRFLLSVLTYSSENTRTDARLRAYLQRTLVPALGI
jgi:AcrR family transcriptional regulator